MGAYRCPPKVARWRCPVPKDLRTFVRELEETLPDELVRITAEVNPANYDVTAIIKHLDAMKKFPVLIFERPLNLKGEVSDIRLMMNAEITQNKAQLALGLPFDMDRARMGDECLRREAKPIEPVVVSKADEIGR